MSEIEGCAMFCVLPGNHEGPCAPRPRRWKFGDYVEVDVPEVDGIGPAYTTYGFVVRAEAGELVGVVCDDLLEHWRRSGELRDA